MDNNTYEYLLDELDNGPLPKEFQDWLNQKITENTVDVGGLIAIIWMVLARLRLVLTHEETMALILVGLQLTEKAITSGPAFTDAETGEEIFTMLAEEAQALGFENGLSMLMPDTLEELDDAADQG